MKDKTLNIIAILLFLACGILLFSNLSDHYLCNDEASTAVMGRNTLNFGYPRAFDGVNWNYPIFSKLILPGTYLWIGDTWVQYYTIALSFKLFGVNTWSARLPFILAGFFTIILLYLFTVRWMNSKAMGLISILLLGTSVPFLLHSRQARYYALVIILCFAIFYCYHRVIEEKKGYFCLAFLFTALSWANHAAFIPMFSSIWFMALFMDRQKIRWKNFIILSAVSVLFLTVWLLIWWPTFMHDFQEYPMGRSLISLRKNLEFQIRTINNYFMPIVFWLVFAIALRIFKKRAVIKPSLPESQILKKIGVILLFNIVFFTLFGMRTMRYYVQYIPFLCLIEAFLLYKIFRWKRTLAVAIGALIIFTNFLSRPDKPRLYFLNYLYELTHEYTGPMEAVSKYLKAHAMSGDKIKIIKGDLEIIFYNPELVVLNDERYYKRSYPEWIVMRKYWNPIYESVWRDELHAEIEKGYLDVLDSYDKIPLAAVDSIRENEPDNLETHFFRAPVVTPENQMFIYRLKNGINR